MKQSSQPCHDPVSAVAPDAHSLLYQEAERISEKERSCFENLFLLSNDHLLCIAGTDGFLKKGQSCFYYRAWLG